MIQVSTYTTVPYEPFDALFRDTYGSSMPRHVFDWKYGSNPHGPVTLWVATDEGEDAWLGALALFPRQFRHASGRVLAGQLADGMVSRAARRRGIFRELLNRVEQEHTSRGYDFLFGLCEADGMSVHALRKMPFLHEIGNFQSSFRLLRAEAVSQLVPTAAMRGIAGLAVNGWLGWVDRDSEASPDAIADGAFSSDEQGFVVDEEWVQWRLAAPGTALRAFKWQNGGAIVGGAGSVANIQLLRIGGQKRNLQALARRLREEGRDRVRLIARTPPRHSELLRSAGFIKRRKPDSLVLFAGQSKTVPSLLAEFSAAWVGRADLDVP